MEEVLNKIKYTRILAIIGLSLCFLSVFFPYVTISATGFGLTISESLSLINYWEGYVVLVATFANFLFIFKDIVEKYVPGLFKNNFANAIKNANPKLGIIPPVFSAIFALIVQTRTSNAANSLVKLTFGFGFYALWAGVILSIVFIFVYKKDGAPQVANNSNNNGGLNQFMNSSTQPQTGMNQYMGYNESMMSNENGVSSDNMMNNQSINPPVQPQMEQPVQSQIQPQMEQSVQPQNAVKYCPTCGAQCDGNANFCNTCGNRL